MHCHRTTDLAPDERIAVERLLGRPLREDEEIEVSARPFEPQSAVANRRKQAAVRIRELAKGKTLNGTTVRELIDEGRRF